MCSTAQRREEVLMHAQGRGREVTDGCWRHAIGNAVADRICYPSAAPAPDENFTVQDKISLKQT